MDYDPLRASDAASTDAATFSFRCASVTSAVGTPVGDRTLEPAISDDGLTLYTDSASGVYRESVRATLSDSFLSWQASSILDSAENYQDLEFFRYQNAQRAIVAHTVAPTARAILYCATTGQNSNNCQEVSIIDEASNQLIDFDMDGPNIAFMDGTPRMVFNSAQDAPIGEHLYLASATDASLLNWTARRLSLGESGKYNDPTLSADGQLLLFPVGTDEEIAWGTAAIYVATWDDIAQDYIDARPVMSASGMPLQGAAPEIHGSTETGFEIFTHAGEDLDTQIIYRSRCTF
jgi:hypothetical protein